MSARPLVTVAVLCYRNFKYVYEALDSVFAQDYPNIELYVSDDGSPDFPVESIEHYLKMHLSANVKSIRINHNADNLGTVGHLNHVIKNTNGKGLLFLAGDDCLNGPSVITRFMDALEKPGCSCDISMSQVAMCGTSVDTIYGYFVDPVVKAALTEKNHAELFRLLCKLPCFPSVGTFFLRSFFEKYGLFDQRYFLIEDWPKHLFIAKNQIPIEYIDFVSVLHRDGGVSHGNIMGNSATSKRFSEDLLRVRREEIAPYIKQFSSTDQRYMKAMQNWERVYHEPAVKNLKRFSKLLFLLTRFPNLMLPQYLERIYSIVGSKALKLAIGFVALQFLMPLFSVAIPKSLTILFGVSFLECNLLFNYWGTRVTLVGFVLFGILAILSLIGKFVHFIMTPQNYY